jgi:hypothetical protein
MKSRKHSLAFAFAASIAMTGAASLANAGPMHGGHSPGAHAVAHMHADHGHDSHGPGHWHGHHRWVGFGAYPVLYSSSGCGWLHRKAVTTGSHYWWSRYEACIDG